MDQTASSPSVSSSSFDFQKFINRVKLVLTNPVEAWTTIKGESTTVKTIYVDYLIPLALITPVCAILKRALFGAPANPLVGIVIPTSLASVIGQQVVMFVMTLIMMFISMHIMAFLAPKFQGVADQVQALKLGAYAMTPSSIAGLLMFIPFFGTLGALIGAIWTIYLFWIGIPVVLNVPTERRVPFVLTVLVVNVIVAVVLSALFGGMLR